VVVVVEVVEVVANVGVVMFTPPVVEVVDSVAIVTIAPGLDFFDEVPKTTKATTRATATMARATAVTPLRRARFSNSVDGASLILIPYSFNQSLRQIG
jgi:hypothetical protein